MTEESNMPVFKTKDYIYLDKIDSTNNFAKLWLQSHSVKSACVISTHEQYAGRGQQGNTWVSMPGENLSFSIVIPLDWPVIKQYALSQAVCLGIIDFLAHFDIKAQIKWPNDIYYGTQKIAGILVENMLRGSNIKQTIIGIGLNVNQVIFPEAAGRPCSMQQITGQPYDVRKMLFACSNSVGKRVLSIGNKNLNAEFHQYLYNINKTQEFRTKIGEKFVGVIQYVEEDGRLVVHQNNGEIKKFFFKEIEYIFAK